MKKLYGTFLTTRYDLLKAHWAQHSALQKSGVTGTNTPMHPDVDLGGIAVSFNWETKEITTTPITCPSGMVRWGAFFVVASMKLGRIYLLDDSFAVQKEISHPYMNAMHSLFVSRHNTLYVANTGLDAILEFSIEGTLLWSWFAFEHGYAKDQYGNTRIVTIENTDHRLVPYPALFRTTHLNSIIEHPLCSELLLATLFHQGEIISIDKKTGKTTTLFSGLTNPHSVKGVDDGFIVSNTKKGEVLFLDYDFKVTRTISIPSEWLQDATISPWGTLFVVCGDTGILGEFSIETGEEIDSYRYNENWRAYQVLF